MADRWQDLNTTLTLVLIGAGAYIVYKTFFAPPDPNDTTGDPNSIGDTSTAAYSGLGILGNLGNAVNQALGGVPQSLGNGIGGNFASLTNESQEQ